MPRITMTITSSISVNPSSCLRIVISLSFSGPQPSAPLARVGSLIDNLQLVKHLAPQLPAICNLLSPAQQGRAKADQDKQADECRERSCQPRRPADAFVGRVARRFQVGIRQGRAIL